jgi:leucyl aminopeptidase
LPAPYIEFRINSDCNPQSDTEVCEALVYCFSHDYEERLAEFSAPIAHVIRQAINQKLGTGSLELVIPTMGHHPVPFFIIFYNKAQACHLQQLRELGARTAQLASQHQYHHIAVDLTSSLQTECTHSLDACVGAWSEGIGLGSYRIESYKQSGLIATQRLKLVQFMVQGNHNSLLLEQAIAKAITYADATNYARDLTNMPSNMLTPTTLSEEALLLKVVGQLSCEVLGKAEIESLGMGGLIAVGQGSVHEPRMIVLRYEGSPQSETVYGLVGKGITFDTGGISLKKADGMEEMISDMGGAAVILGVMKAIVRLKPQLNVVAVIPAAENMPSGSAYKPGDIITSMSGRTIEVLNTDAEGRIVLADAITYARQLGATKLIDVATLTGAVLVALGDVATAAVTNDEEFLAQFMKAADRSGEKVWQLPVYPEYKEMLTSTVADIKNKTSNRFAGAITGGLFIGAFADDMPWIHLDTGGTAWLWKARGLDPQGATGAMVRTLLQYLEEPNA